MRQAIRRVVTGHDKNGQSVITVDDDAPNVTAVQGWRGLYITELWMTGEMPVDNMGDTDQGARPMRHDPTPNGSIFRMVEFPPESSMSGIDTQRAFEAFGSHNKPRAQDSAKHASMHKTNSIDYLVVTAGEMWMVMEDGETLLKPGDCIVQRGTNSGREALSDHQVAWGEQSWREWTRPHAGGLTPACRCRYRDHRRRSRCQGSCGF